MQITQADAKFKPITLRLETVEEVTSLWACLIHATKANHAAMQDIADKYRGMWYTQGHNINTQRISHMFHAFDNHLRREGQ